MKHEERVTLAKTILHKIERKYGNHVLVGGVYGSVARGDDTELSDIDMILITKNDVDAINHEFLFKEIPHLVLVYGTTRSERYGKKPRF